MFGYKPAQPPLKKWNIVRGDQVSEVSLRRNRIVVIGRGYFGPLQKDSRLSD